MASEWRLSAYLSRANTYFQIAGRDAFATVALYLPSLRIVYLATCSGSLFFCSSGHQASCFRGF